MKNVLALIFFVIIFGISSGISQTSLKNIRSKFSDEKIAALNFIDNISFTPAGIIQSLPASFAGDIPNETSENITKTPVSEAIERISSTQFKYAMLMDVAVESLINTTLYNFIEDWFGTRYRMGGYN